MFEVFTNISATEFKIMSNGDKLETIPSDARFHNQNVSNWCMTSFVDYHKCVRLLGEG